MTEKSSTINHQEWFDRYRQRLVPEVQVRFESLLAEAADLRRQASELQRDNGDLVLRVERSEAKSAPGIGKAVNAVATALQKLPQ